MRGSTDDLYKLSLIGQTSQTYYGPFFATSKLDGTYTVEFKFTKVEAYTLSLMLEDEHIVGSPIYNINVHASDVQAYYSELVYKQPVIVAGSLHTWQIEAQDIYQNVVVGTDESFGFQIADLDPTATAVKEVDVEYNFSLYHATFSIEKASDYSAVV